MNKILVILSLVLLVSCGPSQEEKQQQAVITCNVIEATKRMDIASTIREINTTRETIGESLFVDGSETVENAVFFGLCEEMVMNKDNWEKQLISSTETLYASLLKVNLIDYQELVKEVPNSLMSGFYKTESGKKRNFAYQQIKNMYLNDNGQAGEMMRLTIKNCSGSKAFLDFLKVLGECSAK
jgi:hypothetical protein